MNFEDLQKLYRTDYIQNIENEITIPNFSVSSNLNPDIVNFLDAFDEVIAKSFKVSEPEELFQSTSRKKTPKVRKNAKVTTKTGRGPNKKGDSQNENGIEGGGEDVDGEPRSNDADDATGTEQLDNTCDNSNSRKVLFIL